MKPKEQEILDELLELAHDGAGKQLADFFMFAMTQEDIRTTIENEQVNKIFFTINLLKKAAKLPEK